jgi:cold shock CspA family protein/cytochrome c-type biogenesis protein CcmH/NrfF
MGGVYAVQVNESTGPGGYGWQQVYDVPAGPKAGGVTATRITGSADRMYYDYGYKEIQVSGRYENYWSTDCGWWYVSGTPTIYVSIYDNASNPVISENTPVSTTRGLGTYTYTWGSSSNEKPGEWTVLVRNQSTPTGSVVAQFKIFVRGQLNITAISVNSSSPRAGDTLEINATLKDHSGNLVGQSALGSGQVTAYIVGPGESFEVTLTDTDDDGNWTGTFTPSTYGDYVIVVKATDGHNKWLDGRGKVKVGVAGSFPYSLMGPLFKVALAVALAFWLLKKPTKRRLNLFLIFLIVLFFLPRVNAVDTGRYNISKPDLEIEGSTLANQYDSTARGCITSVANSSCHLRDNNFGTSSYQQRGTTDLNGVTHPGSGRDVAGFFPDWVHRHHGGSNWPRWKWYATDAGDQAGASWALSNLTEPRQSQVDSGYGDAEIGSGFDISFNRTHYGSIGSGGQSDIAYESEPVLGRQDSGNNADDGPYGCTYGLQDADELYTNKESLGCHGVDGTAPDWAGFSRTDNVNCSDCHGNLNLYSTNNKHNNTAIANCSSCHNAAYVNSKFTIDGTTNVTLYYCANSTCHPTSVINPLNTSYLHAGRDCRYCHGHGHNITSTPKSSPSQWWNTSCGSQDDICHGSGAPSPRNVGVVQHNVTAGFSNPPDCTDCHSYTSSAHNVTSIPACSKCHNSTTTWGKAYANQSVPNWIDSETNNMTHGDLDRGNRGSLSCKFCHNQSSYHFPGFRVPYYSGGCNNTQCHGNMSSPLMVGSNLTQINRSHSTLDCSACHNNKTIKSASSNAPININTNLHASNSSWLIPFNVTTKGYVSNTTCLNCHDNSSYIDPSLNCTECHGVSGKLNVHTDLNVNAVVGDGIHNTGDCGACHASSSRDIFVNFSAVNRSFHGRLNENASNSTPLTWGNVTKACWACHGDGSQPSGHPSNYKSPWNCTDCHTNGTGGLNASTGLGNYSAKAVFEHFDNTSAGMDIDIVTSVGCVDCHNNSVVDANDTVYRSIVQTGRSNVSHYGVTDYLTPGGLSSSNCSACHRNQSAAELWGVPARYPFTNNIFGDRTIRHSGNETNSNSSVYCKKCHNTSTGTTYVNLHAKRLTKAVPRGKNLSVHFYFDWEGDDYAEAEPFPPWESCPPCHNNSGVMGEGANAADAKVCEDCHVINESNSPKGPNGPYRGPIGGFELRPDYIGNEEQLGIPIVKEHINAPDYYTSQDVNISTNLSEIFGSTLVRSTSCLGFNASSGNGSCHGVAWEVRSLAGDFFAFNKNRTKRENNATYHYQLIVDYLPDSRNCTFCHLSTDSTLRDYWGNATYIPNSTKRAHNETQNSQCYDCHAGGSAPYNFHSTNVNPGIGGADCGAVGCHADLTKDIFVNFSAVNRSFHGRLNENASNSTPLTWGNVTKACWACHGDGSQPSGHPSNYKSPWNCTDCHTNGTGGLNASTGLGNYSAKAVFEHFDNTSAGMDIDIVTSVGCVDCHNNSVVDANDTVYRSIVQTGRSNVSHYGVTDYLTPGGLSSSNCSACHRNQSAAELWGVPARYPFTNNIFGDRTIRHSGNETNSNSSVYCKKCHNTSTGTTYVNLHAKRLTKAVPRGKNLSVHFYFDWEGDDYAEAEPFPPWESCPPCHNNSGVMGEGANAADAKVCEDCHVINESNSPKGPNGPYRGPIGGFELRPDYIGNEEQLGIPIVKEHINAPDYYTSQDVNISTNLSEIFGSTLVRSTSCLGFNASSGNGSCHGVAWEVRSLAGDFFAFNKNRTKRENNATYHYQLIVDYLPDSRNCTFCHLSTDSTLRDYWGNATYIPTSPRRAHDETTNTECYGCHTSDNQAPYNFHSTTLATVGCRGCHLSWSYMNNTKNAPTKYVNESLFSTSVHGNESIIDCDDCHTGDHGSFGPGGGPEEYSWKWCECCHTVMPTYANKTPIISTGAGLRHNMTYKPQYLYYNITGTLQTPIEIDDCTACHDSTLYNNAKSIFNRSASKDCTYCHPFPDKLPGGD